MAITPTKVVAVLLFIIAGVVLLYGAVQSYRQAADFKAGLQVFFNYFLIAFIFTAVGISFLRGGT